MNKGTFLLSLLCLLLLQLPAQENWITNFDEAIELAQEKEQRIILSFQGSDWCAPCIILEKEIWNSEEFKAFANDNVVLLKADFPKRKANRLDPDQQKHNDMLAEKYNPQGFFPLVVVLDENGKALGKLGYERVTPMEYIEKIKAF